MVEMSQGYRQGYMDSYAGNRPTYGSYGVCLPNIRGYIAGYKLGKLDKEHNSLANMPPIEEEMK